MPKTKTISKKKAIEVIDRQIGKFFTATFEKKNGKDRILNGRQFVKKGLKGKRMRYNPTRLGLLPIWEAKTENRRMINLNTLKVLKAEGMIYKVRS